MNEETESLTAQVISVKIFLIATWHREGKGMQIEFKNDLPIQMEIDYGRINI